MRTPEEGNESRATTQAAIILIQDKIENTFASILQLMRLYNENPFIEELTEGELHALFTAGDALKSARTRLRAAAGLPDDNPTPEQIAEIIKFLNIADPLPRHDTGNDG